MSRKVTVYVDAIGDKRFKQWVKILERVDTAVSDGYAFEGTFISHGRKHELPEGTFLLFYGQEGSRKHWHPVVSLREVTASGLKTVYERGNLDYSWALDVRDEIARIINERRAKNCQESRDEHSLGGSDSGKRIATIITHDGVFHTDEVAAVAVLASLFPAADIRRTRNADVIASALADSSAIVVDVGGGRYDHHQPGGNGVRPDGTPYASFGLIWRDFGAVFVRQSLDQFGLSGVPDSIIDEVVNDIDSSVVRSIDAYDTGLLSSADVSATNTTMNIRPVTLQDVILSWNPVNAESPAYDSAFREAVSFVKGVLSRKAVECAHRFLSREVVRSGIAAWSGDPADPIVLEQFALGWQQIVCQTNALFVVFPRLQGGWNVVAIPEEPGSKSNRALAPSEWRGLSDEQLSHVSGVTDAIFCHPSGFLFAAQSRDSAVQMAKRAAQAARMQEASVQGDDGAQQSRSSPRSSRAR